MGVSDQKALTFVDVFAGCGGLSLGLLQAGLRGLFALEQDQFAFETLRANLLSSTSRYQFDWPAWLPKAPTSVGDFLSHHTTHLQSLEGSIDILVGGPPCQGFSSAGRRRQNDPRNRLFSTYLELVELLKPKVVIIENVRGFMVDFDNGSRVHNFARALRRKLAKDYVVHDKLLALSDFGVPQLRTRYFLFATERGLYDEDPFRLIAHRLPSYLRSLGLRPPVSSWAAISDLEIARGGKQPSDETRGFDEIRYTTARTHYQKLMRDGSTCPSDLRLARHATEIVKRFSDIIEDSHAQGRLNTSISDEIRARYGLQKRALRVLDPDRPSPTVTSMPDDLLHYSEPRTLTVRENARLQSFPDWFAFKGKYTTGGHLRRSEVPRFTQVANAVPPLVARAIGESLPQLFERTVTPRHTQSHAPQPCQEGAELLSQVQDTPP